MLNHASKLHTPQKFIKPSITKIAAYSGPCAGLLALLSDVRAPAQLTCTYKVADTRSQ